MDRPTGHQRDMVFCHECENEWYRDEHGLTCPDCQSDFTEIIEPQHDPREDLFDNDDDEDNVYDDPPLLHDHNPWAEHEDAPDPDEGDISNFQWTSNAPNNMTFHGTFSRTFSPADFQQPRQAQQDPTQGPAPLYQNFMTMLNGMMGGRPADTQQPTPAEQAHGSPTGSDRARSPQGNPQQQNQTGPGGFVFTRNGTGSGFSWTATTSTRLFPRDANHAQPQGQPFDDLPNLLNQMFQIPPQGGQGAHGPFQEMGPLGGLFAGLMNPANMQHGDAVYSQEALDRIITQLMEQNQAGNAPGPATADAIASLPQKSISESDLGENGKADCSICMDEVQLGDKVTLLPCSHWFHGDCIKAWLGEHDTCPHCRQGIMPKDGPADASAPRAPEEPPRHDQHWGQGDGTQANPWAVPESPDRQQRRDNEAGPSGGNGGLFNRMRDAFGGGSGPSDGPR
ncbi:hypothetical protein MBLNU459_g7944t1 [Dothideomycetes sp. NU459]